MAQKEIQIRRVAHGWKTTDLGDPVVDRTIRSLIEGGRQVKITFDDGSWREYRMVDKKLTAEQKLKLIEQTVMSACPSIGRIEAIIRGTYVGN